jgi:flagellar basal-body rod protein FlgF
MQNNTLLIGLSRQNALRRELDIVANNIANMTTTGFKADGAVFSEFLSSSARTEHFTAPDRKLSFVHDRTTWHDMSQGPLQQTGNPLDISIEGEGFLVVQTPRGERYTRNGALQVNANGLLVTSAGDQVLGENGPITFNQTDRNIVFNKDGTIRVQEGTAPTTDGGRGKLRLVRFADPQQLLKDSSSTFAAPAGMLPEEATNARIAQGAIEKSNVRSVVEMTRMIELSRAYADVAGIMQQQHDLRRSSIERLAEVPA